MEAFFSLSRSTPPSYHEKDAVHFLNEILSPYHKKGKNSRII